VNHRIDKLWERVRNGDQNAWAKLVRRYAGLVNTVARRVGLSALDAEDCAQHTWLALYRNRGVIRDPLRLPAWLILTTKRHAVRMLNRQYRQSGFSQHIEPGTMEAPPDEELLRLERQDVLRHAIEQLDERCRQLMLALFLSPDNLSYREIAKTFKISPNTMGPLRSKCLKRLKKILDKTGYWRD
jgi:RNA polymerase sigma factor (sigma-70 family)